MSTRIPPEVRDYLKRVESGTPRACKDQIAFAKYIRRVFREEKLIIDKTRLEQYMGLLKYYPYGELYPWERCLFTLWNCTYKAPGMPRWPTLFCMVARGAGKDGFIAFDIGCMISPYNPVKNYDVDICANNEEQAMRPLEDFIQVLETPQFEAKLKKHYYHTKEVARGFKNHGKAKGRTNNPKGRDGMRSGKIIFNEVHQYENYNNIKVFRTGLGKVEEPRIGIFTSNGDVNDGPLDNYLDRSNGILFENYPDNGFLPFVCRLDSKDEVHDELNWYKANPSLQYTPSMLQETRDEYIDWCDHPEENGDFLTKRMGLRAGFGEISVTDYEKVLATNKEIPDMTRRPCVATIDYAEVSDFASVNLHFRIGDNRYDINHSWLCLQSKTLARIKAPWKEWADKGLITLVDDVSISPDLLASYVLEMGKTYQIKRLGMDNFRWTLVADAFKKIGFDANDKTKVKLVRTQDIMKTEPLIQECFDRGYFYWGNNPVLRWATNNTKRVRSSKSIGSDTGNFYYAKIEAKSRKTDPFMALVAGMVCEDVLGTGQAPAMPPIGTIIL